MTHQAKPRNALEALLTASCDVPPELLRSAQSCRTVASSPRHAAINLDRAALTLLARVLTYRALQGPPIIQLSVCVGGATACMVAAPLARACAVLVGRTLQVSTDKRQTDFVPDKINGDPLPDAFLPGLYHKHISIGDTDLIYGPARAEALAALARPFRFLVVDMSGCCTATAVALAPFCTCTILVVEAGVTPLAAVRGTAASISAAGGRVVGTVLATSSRDRHSRLSS